MAPAENKGRVASFWFWNDKLEQKKLLFQLRDIKSKGIDEVVVHARYGLPQGAYLSSDWFYHVGAVLKEAEELGMGVWIYDENNWPSGTADGRVTRNPEYAAKVCWEQNGRIEVRPADFRTKYEGHLYVDNLSKEATRAFISETHEQYYKRFPQYFGRTILGFFDDERGLYASFKDIEDAGTFPVSASLRHAHKELHGIPLKADILKIYGGQESANRQARLRFFQTTAQLYTENLKQIRDWCRQHEVLSIGHLLIEEDPLELVKTQADPFAALSAFDFAGYDLIGGFHPEKQILAARFAESVAKTYGKRIVMAETFGAFGNDLQAENMRDVLQWQAQNGTNKIVLHALYYSLKGDRKFECPPSLMKEPIWKEMPAVISDFQSKLKAIDHSSEFDAVYYPVKSIQAAYNPRDPRESRRIAKALAEKTSALYHQGIRFDLLDDLGVIKRLSQHGRLHVPRSTVMPIKTLQEIAEFSKDGGTVVFYDGKPRFAQEDSEQKVFDGLMDRINNGRTETILVARRQRRLNVWNVLEPLAASLDYKLWYSLPPRRADQYSRLKGAIGVISGYVTRRLAR